MGSQGEEAPEASYVVDQPYYPGISKVRTRPCIHLESTLDDHMASSRLVSWQGEVKVTLVGDTPYELQLRKPVKDSFSATFKAGAQYQKCDLAAPKWEGLRNALRLSCGKLRSSLPPSARLCTLLHES